MQLESTSTIHRNVQDVFILVRDNLDKIVPFLPNISKVNVLEKVPMDPTNPDGKLKITNKWFAKADIPSVAKKFIKPDIFCWKDCAIWDPTNFSVQYHLESYVAKDLFKASGCNTFKAVPNDPNSCEIHFSCTVQIFPEKIPGVPKFLASTAMPHLEKMIQNMLRPNLTMLGEGITKYYAGK